MSTRNPNYLTRRARKARAILQKPGDRPLRNQQKRLIMMAISERGSL